MSTSSILVLGAGTMQMPALRIAREEGLRVVCFDGNPQAVGRHLADEFRVIDISDSKAVVAGARSISDIAGVLTAGTDFSLPVAHVAHALGLPGISPDVALRATDKALMRKVLFEAGVPVPRFLRVDAAAVTGLPDQLSEARRRLRFPIVVKPVDNMGARGVRRCDIEEQLPAAVTAALAVSRTGNAILEELIPGPEFSLDAIVYKGRIRICGVADRHIRFPPYFVETGHTMPTTVEPDVRRAVEDVFRQAIAAIGIDHGAAKGDVFYVYPDGDEPGVAMVGEIAARLSGGYMSGWTYPYASGLESTRAAVRIAVGRDPGLPAGDGSGVAAERAIISIPGTLDSFLGVDESRGIELVRDVFLLRGTGDRLVFPTTNVEKCGNVIASGPDYQAVVQAAETAAGRIIPRLEPADETTFRYLFVDHVAHPFFESPPQGHRAQLSALPLWREEFFAEPQSAAPSVTRLPGGPGMTRCHVGLGWKESLELLESLGVNFVSEGYDLGLVFFRALAAGGVQGALFLVDTLSEDPGWFRRTWSAHGLAEESRSFFSSWF